MSKVANYVFQVDVAGKTFYVRAQNQPRAMKAALAAANMKSMCRRLTDDELIGVGRAGHQILNAPRRTA